VGERDLNLSVTLSGIGMFIFPARGQSPEQQAADAAQAQAQSDQAVEEFKKAAGVCLEGRGYTVN
jgi:hypothetical protein